MKEIEKYLGDSYPVWHKFILLYDTRYSKLKHRINAFRVDKLWSFDCRFCYDICFGLLERENWTPADISVCIDRIVDEMEKARFNFKYNNVKTKRDKLLMLVLDSTVFSGNCISIEEKLYPNKELNNTSLVLGNSVYTIELNKYIKNIAYQAISVCVYTTEFPNVYQLTFTQKSTLIIVASLDFNIYFYNMLTNSSECGLGKLSKCKDLHLLRKLLLS